MKKAWIITHDEYIDRRIFFFAEFFMERGYMVKLFSSYYNYELGGLDNEYVFRPEITEIVKDYREDKSISVEQLDYNIQGDLNLIITAQEEFFKLKGRYAKDNELCLNNKNYRVIMADEKYFSCGIKGSDKSWYIYNSITGNVRETDLSTSVPDEIRNIKLAYHKMSFISDTISDGIKSLYQFGYTPSNNYKTFLLNGENGIIIRSKDISNGDTYEYQAGRDVVLRKAPILVQNIGKDMIFDKEYDYTDFRKIIFDYSPILERIKMELDQEERGADLVYVADLPTLPIGVMLKESNNCKLIIDCHEWWKEQSILFEPENALRIEMMDKYEKSLYPLCDLRITVGHNLAGSMERYFGCPFEVIYSCVKEKEMFKERDPFFWMKNFGVSSNAKVAVFQGSLTVLRNLENLARATKYLTNENLLVIVGDGYYLKDFKSIVEKEGSPERVFYTGWIEQRELLKYTINAGVGVIPYKSVNSYYGMSMPNKFLEYYTARIPIICDKSMLELSDIVEENKLGFSIDCSCPEEIADTINELLGNDQLQLAIALRYEKAGKKLAYDSQGDLFVKMLDSIV